MKEGKVVINNKLGMHARATAQFVAFTNKYKESDIILLSGDRRINAKSIMNILSLGLQMGDEVVIQVTGGEEESVLGEITGFVSQLAT